MIANDMMLGSATRSNVIVNVYNRQGQTARVEETQNPNGELTLDVFIERLDDALGERAAQGNSTFGRALEGAYGLNRGRGA